MKVKVNLFDQKIKKLSEAQIKAVKSTAEQMRADLIESQFLPFDTGHLQNTMTNVDVSAAKSGEVKITHDTSYAARLYYHPEYNFDKINNPNVRGLWWEPWLTGKFKDRPSKIFKYYFKKEAGV